MTIDGQVEKLSRKLAFLRGKAGKSYEREYETFQAEMRLVMLEVARDQRHACADAVSSIFAEYPIVGDGQYTDSGMVHQAILNADLN